MRARLADERGFTLVELLAALVVGSIVIFAGFGLLDTAVRLQAKSVDSLDATDRGRVAIDQISQSLASRICLGSQTSLVDARDDRVEYYASLAPESGTVRLVVQRRRLSMTRRRSARRSGRPARRRRRRPCRPRARRRRRRTRVIVDRRHADADDPVFRYYATDAAPRAADAAAHARRCRPSTCRASRSSTSSFTAQGKRSGVVTTFTNQIFNRSTTCVV